MHNNIIPVTKKLILDDESELPIMGAEPPSLRSLELLACQSACRYDNPRFVTLSCATARHRWCTQCELMLPEAFGLRNYVIIFHH